MGLLASRCGSTAEDVASARARAPADSAALEDLLLRVARLADDLPEVLRLSLEPVLVGPADPWHGGRSNSRTARGTAVPTPLSGRRRSGASGPS